MEVALKLPSANEANSEIDFEPIQNLLISGQWVLPHLFPLFRETLRDSLAEAVPATLPTAYLSSLYYWGRMPEVENSPHAIGPFSTELISKHDRSAPFWADALKITVDEKATLASVLPCEYVPLLKSLHSLNTPAYRPILEWLSPFVFFDSSDWLASSQPHMAGAIFLNRSLLGSDALTETLIHEMAHQELFCLNLIDRLVKPHADNQLTYAPFQKTERPAIGRLHAAHSLYRTCQFHAALAAQDSLQAKRFAEASHSLTATVATLSPSDFTPLGNLLIQQCYLGVMSLKFSSGGKS